MRNINLPTDSTAFAWLGSSSGLRVSPLLVSTAQNIIAGNGLGISHELINLEITSPEVPDLTIIDLPGITRVAVENQPQDIGLQVSLLQLGSGPHAQQGALLRSLPVAPRALVHLPSLLSVVEEEAEEESLGIGPHSRGLTRARQPWKQVKLTL